MLLTGAWDTAAWWVSILLVLGLPVTVIWYVIHPLAAFWRRVGAHWAYLTVCLLIAVVDLALWQWRDVLLAQRFGVQVPLVVLGALVTSAGVWVGVLRQRQLSSAATLLGGPELSRHHRGKLLTQGVYARVRHPRYVEVTLGYWGMALMANTLAGYAAAVLLVPVLLGIVVLEERELRQRFGAEYDDYCRRVPRFIPRR